MSKWTLLDASARVDSRVAAGFRELGFRPDDYVKLIFTDGKNTERMWVKVLIRKADGTYGGRLDNEPAFLDLDCGDPVDFESKHVLDVRAGANWPKA